MNPFEAIGNFFGFNRKKKREDEPTRPQPTLTVRQANPATISMAQPASVQMPGSLVVKDTQASQPVQINLGGVQVKQPPQDELNQLTQQNMEAARQKARQGEGFFQNVTNVFDHHQEKLANTIARNKAASQYQEEHGYNNPAVSDFNQSTLASAKQNSKSAGNTIKATNTAVDILKLVPGANAGEGLADITRSGVGGIKDIYQTLATGRQTNRNTIAAENENRQQRMGVTPQQWQSMNEVANKTDTDIAGQYINPDTKKPFTLDEAQRYIDDSKAGIKKVGGLQAFDTALGAADFIPAGGLVKDVATVPLKQLYKIAAEEQLRNAGKDITTKAVAKQIVKNEAVKLGIGTGAGTILGGGSTALLGGDPKDIVQNSIQGAEYGVLGSLFGHPIDIATDATAVKGGIKTGLRSEVDNVTDTVGNDIPTVDRPVLKAPDDPSLQRPTVAHDPNAPITPSVNATPTQAITSPNRPAPTVQAPKPVFSVPETVGNRASQFGVTVPEGQMPKITPKVQTPDEAVMAVQKAIDDAAVEAPVQPPASAVVDVESPKAAQTRQIAEAQTPVAPVNEADIAQAAANDAPTQAIADELGTITRTEAGAGRLNTDADAQAVADRVGNAIESEAQKLGTTWEEINKKVQAAWSKGAKNYQEAGLTKEEFDVARKAADELSTLRSRIDPSLLGEGHVGQFYSPRQLKDTEFTQDLVNELSRDPRMGLRDNELDLSTTPYRQAIRRYSNAPEALGDTLVDSLENKVVKDALGNENIVPTGLKVPDEVKAAFKEDLKPYVAAQDDIIRAADAGDPRGIDEAVSRADKAIDDALTKMAAKLPKDTAEARDAIGAMIAERRAYMQSTVRSNMFLNVVNRMFDQSQKAIVNFGDQALPLVNKITNKMTGTSQPGIATDRISTGLAKKYAKGTLLKQQNRNFMTNIRLAGANAQNPVTKALAKADAAYRSAGTYLTSLGDLSTNAVRATNLAILGKGRAEGLKTADELEAYLVKNLQSPEYMDIYRNMTNNYSGYIGMPQTITSTGEKGGKISDFLSKIDNFTKNALDQTPLPNRVKQEVNDLIMPAITGFAGATSRVAAKQLNALALGIPNIIKGAKMAASDSPNAKAIGQMIMARSIIDGVSAGGVMAGGALLGATGHWTGEYPSDPNERARWEAEGISPNSISINVGDKTIYVQPGRILGVLALPLVLPSVIADAATNGTDPGEAISSIISGTVGQFNENLGADALLGHAADVNNLIKGNESEKAQASKSLLNMLGYSISNINPASGLQNNIANAMDDKKRDTSGGLLDVVAARNPFTRESLPVKTDNLGNEIPNRTQYSLGSAAITVGDGQGDAQQSAINEDGSANIDAEINRLAKGKFEVMPARDVKNSNSQNDAKTLMNSKLYQDADDATKAQYLKDTLLGTKTKDISKDLNDTERSALIEYKLQSDKQRRKWLEDNDNAANYYTANYDNLKARNLLTGDDDDLENKKGARYSMLRAQVDKEFGADGSLKRLYDNTDTTEWKNMTDPESEDYDPDTAGKLLAYDNARTKAGVSGKSNTSSKNKYVLKTGKGSGRGHGGAGSDKFAFASLPSSLVGNTAGSSKGYEDGAPTFKPMADLKAPNTAQIPKGRSISLKRGIQI